MLGAFIGAVLVFLHYYPHWAETEDADLKLAVFSTGPAIRTTPWNLVSEIIGTFVLMFVIFTFGIPGSGLGRPRRVARRVPGRSSSALPLGGTTGYAINPARDLGPRIAHFLLPIPGKRDSDWGYAWIPVVGPLIGAALAYFVYNVGFANYMMRDRPAHRHPDGAPARYQHPMGSSDEEADQFSQTIWSTRRSPAWRWRMLTLSGSSRRTSSCDATRRGTARSA